MTAQRFFSQLSLGLLAITLAVALPAAPSRANCGGTGLTILGGVDAELRLPADITNNTPRNTRARYALSVPGDRVQQAVSQLSISYPDAFSNYRGRFNVDSITVHKGCGDGGTEISIDEIVWTEEDHKLDIYLFEDIPADTTFTIVMNSVRNPNRALQQRFGLAMQYRGDVLPVTAGIWELLIGYDDQGSR